MVLTGSMGQRQMHGNSLERRSTGKALLRRPCWERLHGAEAAGCVPPVLPIPPGSCLVGRKALCSVFSSWKVSYVLNKEGNEALGQVGGLETSCSSKQIPWLVPEPPSLRAKKGAAEEHEKTGMGMAARAATARRCPALGGKNGAGLL